MLVFAFAHAFICTPPSHVPSLAGSGAGVDTEAGCIDGGASTVAIGAGFGAHLFTFWNTPLTKCGWQLPDWHSLSFTHVAASLKAPGVGVTAAVCVATTGIIFCGCVQVYKQFNRNSSIRPLHRLQSFNATVGAAGVCAGFAVG
jgi:hypothetical protein